jgi:nicotinate-nucleotide adenylyltransferase
VATARYVAEGRARPQRIGVFGSSFNPPQLAHLSLVEAAREQLALDLVLVVPTGDPYHKKASSDPGPRTRFRMTEAAFSGIEDVLVLGEEVDRPGPSYTYATLERIAERYPDSEIHLLMGADAAITFGGWKRPERILQLAKVAVVPRPGVESSRVSAAFDAAGGSGRLELLELPATGVSSSEVRRRIESGKPFEGLVPRAVAEMINNEGVYGSEL